MRLSTFCGLHRDTEHVVSQTGKKPLPLYPTMEESFFRCIPQRKKTSSVVSHNGGKYLPLWDTTEEKMRRCGIQCGRFFWNTVHCIRFCCGVGYNGRKISCVVGYNRKKLFAILRFFSVVSHNGKNPLLLYPTTKENLFRCIPQRKKTLPLYPTTEKNLFRCIPQRYKKR
jgi:hypothetical protein